MSTATNTKPETPSTFASRFGMAGLADSVRSLTVTMLEGWDDLPVGRRVPRDPKLASLKADVRNHHVKPIEHILRLAFAAVDAGVSVQRVTQFLRDTITVIEQHAEGKQRRESSGVLSFPARLARLWTRETKEQGEADCAIIAIGEGTDLNALRQSRVELTEHRDVIDAQIELVSARILEREAGR